MQLYYLVSICMYVYIYIYMHIIKYELQILQHINICTDIYMFIMCIYIYIYYRRVYIYIQPDMLVQYIALTHYHIVYICICIHTHMYVNSIYIYIYNIYACLDPRACLILSNSKCCRLSSTQSPSKYILLYIYTFIDIIYVDTYICMAYVHVCTT